MAHHQCLKRHTSDLLSSRTLHRNSSVCSKGFCKCGKYTTSVNISELSEFRLSNLSTWRVPDRFPGRSDLEFTTDLPWSEPSHVAHDHHICLARSEGGFSELQVHPVQDLPRFKDGTKQRLNVLNQMYPKCFKNAIINQPFDSAKQCSSVPIQQRLWKSLKMVQWCSVPEFKTQIGEHYPDWDYRTEVGQDSTRSHKMAWTKASPWPETACWKMLRDWETSLCFDTWPRAPVCSQSERTLHRWWDMVRYGEMNLLHNYRNYNHILPRPDNVGQYASLWAVNSASVFW